MLGVRHRCASRSAARPQVHRGLVQLPLRHVTHTHPGPIPSAKLGSLYNAAAVRGTFWQEGRGKISSLISEYRGVARSSHVQAKSRKQEFGAGTEAGHVEHINSLTPYQQLYCIFYR